MSQHDYDIANQLSASLRTDLNNALKALNSNNSGDNEPAAPFANMLWYDTYNNILKMKPEDNAAGQWISIGYLDQGTDTFKILDDTVVTTADGGTDAGLLGDQTTETWVAGTGTTESLVSPAKVKAAVDSLVSIPDTLGVNQSYAYTTLTTNTWYQNTTGRAIAIYYSLNTGGGQAYVSTTASNGVIVGGPDGDSGTYDNGYFIVPDQYYYQTSGSSSRFASMLS
jgi:hypothetical protein